MCLYLPKIQECMADSTRFRAIEQMQTRASVEFKPSERQISEYFGIDVFGKEQMREYSRRMPLQA